MRRPCLACENCVRALGRASRRSVAGSRDRSGPRPVVGLASRLRSRPVPRLLGPHETLCVARDGRLVAKELVAHRAIRGGKQPRGRGRQVGLHPESATNGSRASGQRSRARRSGQHVHLHRHGAGPDCESCGSKAAPVIVGGSVASGPTGPPRYEPTGAAESPAREGCSVRTIGNASTKMKGKSDERRRRRPVAAELRRSLADV